MKKEARFSKKEVVIVVLPNGVKKQIREMAKRQARVLECRVKMSDVVRKALDLYLKRLI